MRMKGVEGKKTRNPQKENDAIYSITCKAHKTILMLNLVCPSVYMLISKLPFGAWELNFNRLNRLSLNKVGSL